MTGQHDLSRYLPRLVARRLADAPATTSDPWSERFGAAVLLADISGFTALAERLAECGPAGAEELSAILNRCFGSMVELITDFGGDILRFAGDAPIVLWPVANRREPGAHRLELASRIETATACGFSLLEEFDGREVAEGLALSLRVGIAAGEVLATTVGGVHGRRELLVAGEPLDQMGRAERLARPGEVVVSPAAWSLVEQRAQGEERGQGFRCLRGSKPRRPQGPVNEVPPMDTEASRAFIPRPILQRIDAGQVAWLAELRHVSVLFVGVRRIDYAAPDAPQRAHAVLEALQTTVYRLGGSINQFLVDDKGTTLLAAWGLPTSTHEDNAARALQAGLAARDALNGLGLGAGIGVTTGRVFCGARGGDARLEYAMIGSAVNLAARLMVEAQDDVLCDEATRKAARASIEFQPMTPLRLKGIEEPVAVHAASASADAGEVRSARVASTGADEPIGRGEERARLLRALDELREGRGKTLLVQGEAGIGKSTLLEDMLRHARAAGVRAVTTAGDAVSRSEAYGAWRGTLEQLLELPPGATGEERRRRVIDDLDRLAEIREWAPLVNSVLPLDIPENEITSQMSGMVRGDSTTELMVRLIEGTTKEARLLIVVDDAQWLDSASWAVTAAVARRVPGVLLVVGCRPMGNDEPGELDELARSTRTRRIDLARMSAEDMQAMVCRRLAVDRLPRQLGELIREKAGGHPLFGVELASSLLEAGLIAIDDGRCRITENAGDLADHEFPDTVQGIVLSRIDRLSAGEQLTLKVASVIGSVFDCRVLRDVHPVAGDRAALVQQLEALERTELTTLESKEPLTHGFRHAIFREVAYGLMVSSQRRKLHRAVAGWYERESSEDPPWALLAHHWTRAEDDERSYDCLEHAGQQASDKGAPREAARFYRQALDLAHRRGRRSVGRLRRVGWLRRLSTALLELGEVDGAARSLEGGLHLLQRRVPRTSAGWSMRLVAEIGRQIVGRLRPTRRHAGQPSRRERRLIEAAHLFELAGTVAYFRHQGLQLIGCFLASVNLAESAGSPTVAARAYAALAYPAALLRLRRLARRWWRLGDDPSDPVARVRGLINRGLYEFGETRWDRSRRCLDEALAWARRTGSRDELETTLIVRIHLEHFTGRLSEELEAARQLLESGKARGNAQRETWGYLSMGSAELELGRVQEAARRLEAGRERIDVSDSATALVCQVFETSVRLYEGALEQARRSADEVMKLLAPMSPVFSNALACEPVVYAYLATRNGVETVKPAAPELRRARRAVRIMRRASRVYPFARPRAALAQSALHRATGSTRRAARFAGRALRLARRYEMPIERGLAHEQMGLCADAPNAAMEHLNEARRAFERLGCTGYSRRVEAEIARRNPGPERTGGE